MIQAKRAVLVKYLLLIIAIALSFVIMQITIAQEVYVQTGFEEFAVGDPPKDWEVTGGGFEVVKDPVKTDKKALAILGGANGDGLGVPIETDNPIISVEFWIYVESGGRSLNIKVASADNIGENSGCTYINWNADMVRFFDGAAWQPIGDFETDAWKYVRIIADVGKSEFEFALGDDRSDALGAKAEDGLAFRHLALAPTAKWVVFYVWSMTSPAYFDDLLVYEGADPLDLAVDPIEKLTTFWGQVKQGL